MPRRRSCLGRSFAIAKLAFRAAAGLVFEPVFISTVALSALLESLMAFVIADLDESVIASIERFHQRRYDLGIYLEENT